MPAPRKTNKSFASFTSSVIMSAPDITCIQATGTDSADVNTLQTDEKLPEEYLTESSGHAASPEQVKAQVGMHLKHVYMERMGFHLAAKIAEFPDPSAVEKVFKAPSIFRKRIHPQVLREIAPVPNSLPPMDMPWLLRNDTCSSGTSTTGSREEEELKDTHEVAEFLLMVKDSVERERSVSAKPTGRSRKRSRSNPGLREEIPQPRIEKKRRSDSDEWSGSVGRKAGASRKLNLEDSDLDLPSLGITCRICRYVAHRPTVDCEGYVYCNACISTYLKTKSRTPFGSRARVEDLIVLKEEFVGDEGEEEMIADAKAHLEQSLAMFQGILDDDFSKVKSQKKVRLEALIKGTHDRFLQVLNGRTLQGVPRR